MPIADSADRTDILESGYVTATKVVGTVQLEAKVGTSRLDFRQHLTIHNYGPNTIYIGPTGVTALTGRPLFANQTIDMAVGDIAIYLIAETSNNSVVIQELA